MPAKKSPFDYRQTAGFYFSALTKVEGSLNEQEDVVIDGSFEGEIKTVGFCEIGENGHFQGTVQARSLTIIGSCDGEIIAKDSIVVKKSASVHGVIRTPRIGIDSGASIDARIKPYKLRGGDENE